MCLLLHLKRAKVQAEEPVQFYVACIQSVLPHGGQVCHFSLPQYLTITFERILKRALRKIVGYEVHCSDALSRSGLVTLEQRRTELCKKLFTKLEKIPFIFCTLSYHSWKDPLRPSGTLDHNV